MRRIVLVAVVAALIVVGALAFTGALSIGGGSAEGQSGVGQSGGFDGISLMGAP